MIFQKLKMDAEAYLGEKVTEPSSLFPHISTMRREPRPKPRAKSPG